MVRKPSAFVCWILCPKRAKLYTCILNLQNISRVYTPGPERRWGRWADQSKILNHSNAYGHTTKLYCRAHTVADLGGSLGSDEPSQAISKLIISCFLDLHLPYMWQTYVNDCFSSNVGIWHAIFSLSTHHRWGFSLVWWQTPSENSTLLLNFGRINCRYRDIIVAPRTLRIASEQRKMYWRLG